jgi:hypothetical protein
MLPLNYKPTTSTLYFMKQNICLSKDRRFHIYKIFVYLEIDGFKIASLVENLQAFERQGIELQSFHISSYIAPKETFEDY